MVCDVMSRVPWGVPHLLTGRLLTMFITVINSLGTWGLNALLLLLSPGAFHIAQIRDRAVATQFTGSSGQVRALSGYSASANLMVDEHQTSRGCLQNRQNVGTLTRMIQIRQCISKSWKV